MSDCGKDTWLLSPTRARARRRERDGRFPKRPPGRRAAPDEKNTRGGAILRNRASRARNASPVSRADEGLPSSDAKTPPRAPRGKPLPPHSFSTRRERHSQEYRGSFEYDVKRAEPKDKNENASKRKNAKSATVPYFFFATHERSATARSSVFLIPSCGP